jgi:hypothetical protein
MIRRLLIVVFALLLLSNQLQGKGSLISKDMAIAVALKNGLKVGLSEFSAQLENDTVWSISSLICDDEQEHIYDTKLVNAKTGEMVKGLYTIRAEYYERIGGGIIERTKINTDLDFDSLPIVKCGFDRKLTKLNVDESNPVFSDNANKIAFQCGIRKIGIINTDGRDFKEICEDCLYPQWLNEDWIVYFKDFEHIYKKNIHSNIKIRITNEPYSYDKFLISPNKQWIIYQSSEMWPELDREGNRIMYATTDAGEGQNLCIMSIDGKVKKYLKKVWTCYYNPLWTMNSDSILFNISDKKYCAADLDNKEIDYSVFELFEGVSLADYGKVIGGTFPLVYHGQILEIDLKTLKPIRVLVDKIGRYKDVFFSHNKEFLIYSKTDKKNGEYKFWIKRIEN